MVVKTHSLWNRVEKRPLRLRRLYSDEKYWYSYSQDIIISQKTISSCYFSIKKQFAAGLILVLNNYYYGTVALVTGGIFGKVLRSRGVHHFQIEYLRQMHLCLIFA